jgi:hypothetical protein
MEKPTFTEKEIDQLQSLSDSWGYECGVTDVLKVIKSIDKGKYSDIPSFLYLLEKEIKKLPSKNRLKYQQEYPNSSLDDKLIQRLEWTEKNKKSN